MAANQAAMGELMATQLIKAAQVVEEQLDAEIERMEKMDEDDLEALRQKRMAGLKKQQVWSILVKNQLFIQQLPRIWRLKNVNFVKNENS